MLLPSVARRRGTFRAAYLGVVLLLATVLRLLPWSTTFTADGVRFGADGDPYYHVLRARRIALTGEVLWRDPGMNYPVGADVIWPPGFDAAIAAIAWVSSAGEPSPADVDRAGALLPVALGLASVLLVALLASEASGGGALFAATALALSPLHAQYTAVGRADQHAAELVLFLACTAAFARAIRGPTSHRWSVALGVLLAASFWTWQGSSLFVLVPAAFVGVWHVLASTDDPSRGRAAAVLAAACATAGLVLVVTIAALAPAGALTRGGLAGITGAAPVLCAAAAGAAAALAVLSGRPAGRLRRALEACCTGGAALAVALAIPWTRDAMAQGLATLSTNEPWYALIREFQPRFGPAAPVMAEIRELLTTYGLTPLAAAAGAFALLRAGPGDRVPRWARYLVVLLAVIFVGLALFRIRFDLYAIAPVAILAGVGIEAAARRFSPGTAPVTGGILAAITLFPLALGVGDSSATDWRRDEYAALAKRLGHFAHGGTGEAVLASWERGHDVRFFSGFPVVTTPFGVEGGRGAMEDAGAFWLSRTEDEAWAVLARRRVRWVLVQPPTADLVLSSELLGRPSPVSVTGARPTRMQLLPDAWRLVSVRLYAADGLGAGGTPPLSTFRLVDEGKFLGAVPCVKAFERVNGATLHVTGASPGTPVHVTIPLRTRLGRAFFYEAGGLTGPDGGARVRVPYATGRNGETAGGEYIVATGQLRVSVAVDEEDVLIGRERVVRLP